MRLLASFHHIPLVALGLLASTAAVAGRDLPPAVYAAAACGSWAVYAAARLVNVEDDGDDAGALWSWVGFAILAAVASLGRLPRVAWVVGAAVALPAGLDALRRRRAPSPLDAWAKPLLIAAGWTGGALALPLASVRGGVSGSGAALGWHTAAVFAAVAANAVLADAADRALDAAAGRVTLATRWGVPVARALGGAASVMGAACAAMAGASAGLPGGARAALVAAPLAVGVGALRLARTTPSRRWLDLAVGAGGLALLAVG